MTTLIVFLCLQGCTFGDTSSIWPFIIILIAGLGIICLIINIRRKSKKIKKKEGADREVRRSTLKRILGKIDGDQM